MDKPQPYRATGRPMAHDRVRSGRIGDDKKNGETDHGAGLRRGIFIIFGLLLVSGFVAFMAFSWQTPEEAARARQEMAAQMRAEEQKQIEEARETALKYANANSRNVFLNLRAGLLAYQDIGLSDDELYSAFLDQAVFATSSIPLESPHQGTKNVPIDVYFLPLAGEEALIDKVLTVWITVVPARDRSPVIMPPI